MQTDITGFVYGGPNTQITGAVQLYGPARKFWQELGGSELRAELSDGLVVRDVKPFVLDKADKSDPTNYSIIVGFTGETKCSKPWTQECFVALYAGDTLLPVSFKVIVRGAGNE